MWFLTSENDTRIIYVVSANNDVTIGRSADTEICSFAIIDDPSISRKHATLSIIDNSLYLQDLGSRYGTSVNQSAEKLQTNDKVKLSDEDVVKFGKMGSVWKVHQASLVTCTSTLKGENLQSLKSTIAKIGGVLSNEWDNTCMYLTMPAITLTIKVVLALVQGSHIVTTEFWTKCLEAVRNLAPLPDPANYVPHVIESTLNKEVVSFLPDDQRKTLFSGKKIIFFSKRQFEMYKVVLVKSGASPLLLSESQMSKSSLCDEGVMVIQYNITSTTQETEAQRNQINDVVNYLKSKGKRVVADAEIGLAILFCSTIKYCNPDFNFTSEVVKQAAGPQNSKLAKVLAPESQEPVSGQVKRENVIIDESLTSNDIAEANGVTAKRKLSDEGDSMITNANKKVATGATVTNDSGKRKHSDDKDSNPTKKMAVGNDTDGDDFFNFVTPAKHDSIKNKTEDKLNLSKPQKRKNVLDTDEDDLFNFIQKPKLSDDCNKDKIFGENKNEISSNAKKNKETSVQDISAMRGAKLQELMENNKNIDATTILKQVKKEASDELDEKMNLLDLGSTMVVVNKDLIIKKEPVEIEETSTAKNFKKFKKVWPVKMQVTIIPKSSISNITSDMQDVSSIVTSDN